MIINPIPPTRLKAKHEEQACVPATSAPNSMASGSKLFCASGADPSLVQRRPSQHGGDVVHRSGAVRQLARTLRLLPEPTDLNRNGRDLAVHRRQPTRTALSSQGDPKGSGHCDIAYMHDAIAMQHA